MVNSALPLGLGCSQKHGDGDSQDPKLVLKKTKSEMMQRRSVRKRVKLVGLRTVAHMMIVMMMMNMKMLSEEIQRAE